MATDPPPTEEIRGAYFRQAAGRPSGTVAPIVLPFMVTLAALFAVAVASMLILSAVRAYVGGEGLYSKGQRDAVYYLSRYATSRSEADFGRYRDAVAVPLGDREAREALQRRPRDLEHAQRGFLAGGNNPSDVDGMVRLFEVFEHVAQMRTAIDLWTVADRYTSKSVAIGDRLHDRPVDVPLEGRELTVVLAELDAINRQMAPLEADFSATLGHAARQLTTALILALALASMALALFGIRSAMLSREAERRQDARFRALIEHSNDMIAVVSETGAFSYLSPSWAADLGWPEGGAPHSLFDLVHDSDADGLRRSLADVHVKRHRASGRLRLRHIDGRWLTISWSARDATDVAGIGGLIINASDVTSEVALADQLQQARKMEAIGQLSNTLTEPVRT